MRLTSPAFNQGEHLPTRFAREHGNHAPPLAFRQVPDKARSLALIVKDPDAPSGTFVHWVLFNLPRTTRELGEDQLPTEAVQGRNDYGDVGYGGPRPPTGTHRYCFEAYALDAPLNLPAGSSAEQVEQAMETHLLENAQLMGRFSAGQP